MKDKIERAKQKIAQYRTPLVYSAGVAVGSTAMYLAAVKYGRVRAWAVATDPDLAKLLDERKGGFLTFTGPRVKIALMSQNFVEEHS